MTQPRPRVLVVDDEDVIRQILVINFELDGFEVCEAADGLEALERARSFRPDVVILDVMMPRLDGWATARRLRSDAVTAGAGIVFVSARVRPADVAKGRALGAQAYITKPFDPEDVVDTARRLCEGRGAGPQGTQRGPGGD